MCHQAAARRRSLPQRRMGLLGLHWGQEKGAVSSVNMFSKATKEEDPFQLVVKRTFLSYEPSFAQFNPGRRHSDTQVVYALNGHGTRAEPSAPPPSPAQAPKGKSKGKTLAEAVRCAGKPLPNAEGVTSELDTSTCTSSVPSEGGLTPGSRRSSLASTNSPVVAASSAGRHWWASPGFGSGGQQLQTLGGCNMGGGPWWAATEADELELSGRPRATTLQVDGDYPEAYGIGSLLRDASVMSIRTNDSDYEQLPQQPLRMLPLPPRATLLQQPQAQQQLPPPQQLQQRPLAPKPPLHAPTSQQIWETAALANGPIWGVQKQPQPKEWLQAPPPPPAPPASVAASPPAPVAPAVTPGYLALWDCGRKGSPPVATSRGRGGAAIVPAQMASKDCMGRTTVMLKNLPVGLSREMLTRALDQVGFAGGYNFVYVPVSFRTKASMCYAFVNMLDTEVAQRCFSALMGFTQWGIPTDKVCEVTWSDKLQGLPQHIERYRNSPLMHPTVSDDYKPAVFEDGLRVIFPPPTKGIRPPRIRRNSDEDEE